MIYHYRNPKTGEILEKILPISEDPTKPIVMDDGSVWEYVPWYLLEKGRIGIIDKNAEVWEKDADYVKKMNPKFVRRRDGVREKYDPTRHR